MSGRTGVQESVFVEKKAWVCATYELILVSTSKRIGDVLLDGGGRTVAKKECKDTREKNTDRDDVGRACTKHVQMKKGSP